MERSEVLENYGMVDLSFEDYPTPAIMQMAIWVQRRDFRKQYPECEIEIIHYKGYIRIIAHEPAVKESFTFYEEDFAFKHSFQPAISAFTKFLKEQYPDCEIVRTAVKGGIRIDARKQGT